MEGRGVYSYTKIKRKREKAERVERYECCISVCICKDNLCDPSEPVSVNKYKALNTLQRFFSDHSIHPFVSHPSFSFSFCPLQQLLRPFILSYLTILLLLILSFILDAPIIQFILRLSFILSCSFSSFPLQQLLRLFNSSFPISSILLLPILLNIKNYPTI